MVEFMVSTILAFIVLGAIAGFIARFLMPGRDPMGFIATVLLGIAGSFIGGFIFRLFDSNSGANNELSLISIVGAVIGAMVLLFLYRMFVKGNSSRV